MNSGFNYQANFIQICFFLDHNWGHVLWRIHAHHIFL